MLTAFILAALVVQAPSAPARESARAQIGSLVRSFASEMNQEDDPSPFLSPEVTGKARTAQINEAAKGYITLEISDYNLEHDLVFQDPTHATLHAYVHWETPHEENGTKQGIRLVSVDGRWYFQSFSFLEFPWSTVAPLFALLLVYFATVMIFELHWRHASSGSFGRLILWKILLVTPVGLLLYPICKPWRTRGDRSAPAETGS